MIAAPAQNAGLARDTVFAAVMIVCNGIVGACLLAGGVRHRDKFFRSRERVPRSSCWWRSPGSIFGAPEFSTTSVLGPLFSAPQLVFAAIVSLLLYVSFIFVQTIRHRDYFLPVQAASPEQHASAPSAATAWLCAGLLLVALVVIVGLAKFLTPTVESAVARLGVPDAVVGIVIAALVLLPEELAAVRAALGNRLQTSLNLALGSALATIGLTIPAVTSVSLARHQPLELGLDAKDQALLLLTLLLAAMTLSTGRTTVLHGIVHLLIFAVFLFFAVVP